MPRRRHAARPIHVDGETYKWTVATADETTLRLTIWRSPTGRRLQLAVEFLDLSLYFPWYNAAPAEHRATLATTPIRPSFVATAIRTARHSGWNPHSPHTLPPAHPWPTPVRADPNALPPPERID